MAENKSMEWTILRHTPPLCHAEMMGDIMYLQQALKQPNAKEFVQAVNKEVNGHVDSNDWTLQKQSKVP